MPITAYKAFDKNLKCRDFQYEVGKTYTLDGAVKICENGFHSCENPFDCLGYYDLLDSRFALVEPSGDTDQKEGDTKIAASEIYIKSELTVPEFITHCTDWVIAHTSGDAESSGYGAQIGSSGYGAQIGSSGNGAQIGSSGNGAQIGSSGYRAQIGSSGDLAQISSSGDLAQISSSGDWAKITASGKHAVVAAAGMNSKASGAIGAWISLAEFNDAGECVGFASGCIGQDGLKPDTAYRAKDGKLTEVA
jgi:hypothetical protein